MKKLTLVLTLLMIVSLLAFAGGQQEGTEEGGGEAAAAETSEYNIEPPEKSTTIDMIGWAFPITEFYAEEFKDMNSIKNLEVNAQLLDSASAQEQVRLALSGGKKSPYEIVHAANTQVSEWGFPGWLMPLDDLIEKYWDEYDLGDIPETAWEGAKVNGKIMGIPAVSNSFQLIYREDLFEKHNIDIPETIEEVIAASQKLKDEQSIDVPFVINLHAGWAWEIEFFHFLRAHGGKYLNEDNTAAFNSPEGVKALEMMLEIADKAMGKVGMSYSVDDTEVGLQTGRLAFSNTWASRAVNMQNPEKSAYPDELKFAPSPAAVEGGPLLASAWNDFYCIPKAVDVDPELIFKVIMEATDLESQKRAVEHGIPTRGKAMTSEVAGAYMPAAIEGLAKGVGAYPNTPALPIVRTVLGQNLPLVGTGEMSPKEALEKAEKAYTEEARANNFIE
jgi:ABC-type glycerol-3-phosphate transport system substrate-binding protein